VPEAEPPARLAKALWRLLEGIIAIGVDRETAWQVVTKTALDCMPSRRRIVLQLLVDGEELTTTQVAERADQPTHTVRLALEDLTAHRLAMRKPQGQGRADRWYLTEQARGWWEASTRCTGGRERGHEARPDPAVLRPLWPVGTPARLTACRAAVPTLPSTRQAGPLRR
jgi:hypothetical protein